MKEIHIKVTFSEPCLGTASADPELHSSFIASNAPDAPSRQEEIEAIGVEEYENKSKTVFPRMSEDDPTPIFWDYQLKGFFKDACKGLQRMKGEKMSKESCKIKAYKQVIDSTIFVFPRKIPITVNGEIGDKQRPLRAQTAQGERIALANSEKVPAGSSFECTIRVPNCYEAVVMEWLRYGIYKGLGQWRNASWGRFTFEVLKVDSTDLLQPETDAEQPEKKRGRKKKTEEAAE